MPTIEDRLPHQVDEILEPLWQSEQQRATRRSLYANLARVIAGVLLFVVVALVTTAIVGVGIPWIAFACITLVAMAVSVASRSDPFD